MRSILNRSLKFYPHVLINVMVLHKQKSTMACTNHTVQYCLAYAECAIYTTISFWYDFSEFCNSSQQQQEEEQQEQQQLLNL